MLDDPDDEDDPSYWRTDGDDYGGLPVVLAEGGVVTDLDKLIGPDNPTVSQANLFTAPELAAASGIAHDAQLKWMLTIARTVRDLARVVSGTID